MKPTLIILGGLPGTGKSTIGREFCRRHGAVMLRVDTIEHAMATSWPEGHDVGPAGYIVAYRLAVDNLRLGHTVVADTVNPIEITREAWRDVATEAGTPFLEVEVLCSDAVEHRRRVETRQADIAGFTLPTWQKVEERFYEQWDSVTVRIDTSTVSIEQAVETIAQAMAK